MRRKPRKVNILDVINKDDIVRTDLPPDHPSQTESGRSQHHAGNATKCGGNFISRMFQKGA